MLSRSLASSARPVVSWRPGGVSDKPLTIAFIGAPGSGKGTIAKWMIRDFDMKQVSTGDLLRAAVAAETPLGLEASHHMGKSGLVPDNIVTSLLTEQLAMYSTNHVLLDGYPRTLSQTKELETALSTLSRSLFVVVHIDVPFNVIVDRIKGRWIHRASGRVYHTEFNPPQVAGLDDVTMEKLEQRQDDKEEVVRERLSVYTKLTSPLLEYYKSQGKLLTVAGEESKVIYPELKDKFQALVDISMQKPRL